VQKALDEQHVAYEVVRGPWRPRKRTVVIDGTGQPLYPAIRFEDGSWYREESADMARTISEGRLLEKHQGGGLLGTDDPTSPQVWRRWRTLAEKAEPSTSRPLA
jgi:hypothetical protein